MQQDLARSRIEVRLGACGRMRPCNLECQDRAEAQDQQHQEDDARNEWSAEPDAG
jgi:hypothetical protein